MSSEELNSYIQDHRHIEVDLQPGTNTQVNTTSYIAAIVADPVRILIQNGLLIRIHEGKNGLEWFLLVQTEAKYYRVCTCSASACLGASARH
jgi:hypothetical protein